jgi:hypothetical protein
MNIIGCTICGADDDSKLLDLVALSSQYPLLEWGILYQPSRQGSPAYPTDIWLKEFYRAAPWVRKSLHLCGEGLSFFIDGVTNLTHHLHKYQRIQLNIDLAEEQTPARLSKLATKLKSFPDIEFIFPLNDESHAFLPLFDTSRMSVLFDGSGGRGLSPEIWPVPLANHSCGYAGGLGPDNLAASLRKLDAVVRPQDKVWIDMQSGVRSHDNKLDMAKVRSVLDQVVAKVWQPT